MKRSVVYKTSSYILLVIFYLLTFQSEINIRKPSSTSLLGMPNVYRLSDGLYDLIVR